MGLYSHEIGSTCKNNTCHGKEVSFRVSSMLISIDSFICLSFPQINRIILQKCYGAKLKSVHLINAPGYASTLVSAAKMMMKKKLAERIYTHNSVEELYQHISPKYLPKELGGHQKSYAEISGVNF